MIRGYSTDDIHSRLLSLSISIRREIEYAQNGVNRLSNVAEATRHIDEYTQLTWASYHIDGSLSLCEGRISRSNGLKILTIGAPLIALFMYYSQGNIGSQGNLGGQCNVGVGGGNNNAVGGNGGGNNNQNAGGGNGEVNIVGNTLQVADPLGQIQRGYLVGGQNQPALSNIEQLHDTVIVAIDEIGSLTGNYSAFMIGSPEFAILALTFPLSTSTAKSFASVFHIPGQVYAIYIIAIAGAESAIGLGSIISGFFGRKDEKEWGVGDCFLTIGAITTVFSSLIGLFQQDIKKVIAYSTMSQLGAGAVIHAVSDNQDFRRYGGLKAFLPLTYSVIYQEFNRIMYGNPRDGNLEISVPSSMPDEEVEKLSKQVGVIDRIIQTKFSEYRDLKKVDAEINGGKLDKATDMISKANKEFYKLLVIKEDDDNNDS
uniref:NADH:quinone oxidoreductase/Mrp antiporter transmembrane domain-containing protein n=1 Tax=Tanacetum cinerariifolium TaxID=118510 RepID=A0A6L2NVF0_TANCI|nr:hypothetical protein [Tanacetum cinerariifolium]